jgi:lipoprotein
VKTLRILFALFTTVIILTACTSDFSTNEGGESSITRITPTKTYSLSDVTKKEIKENKETIIITEAIDVSQDEVSDMPGVIIKFIKSADKTMTEHNYYLISTDTTGLIPYSRYTRTDTLVITLIFQKNK